MAEQLDLFRADTRWFHLFRSMIDSGDCARIGPHAMVVYLVIKAHANFETGRSFPSVTTIAAKAGVSEKQVKRSLVVLVEAGYLAKRREGRKNLYTPLERFPVLDGSGSPAATMTCAYVPREMQDIQHRIKEMLQTGAIAEGQTVHINLTVQVIADIVQVNAGNGVLIAAKVT